MVYPHTQHVCSSTCCAQDRSRKLVWKFYSTSKCAYQLEAILRPLPSGGQVQFLIPSPLQPDRSRRLASAAVYVVLWCLAAMQSHDIPCMHSGFSSFVADRILQPTSPAWLQCCRHLLGHRGVCGQPAHAVPHASAD